ncbi:MAG: hypothetical protein OEY18_08660 [Candidatus Aminicenantes bacterium]|nr:hypothetical protein [Candidatus Aminicenantes bacterium]MDH5384763.1 hypothetical protein [Candidatus Aminicenantes bacterium]MDH5742219.1 hypothetical protein [Candidatus Aminicenantes bacterium]
MTAARCWECCQHSRKTGPPLALIQPGCAFITDFCVNNAKAVVDAWWELGDDLLVKYNHFRIYDADTRKVDRVQTPESWNRAVIEYDKLMPMTPPPPPPKKKN